MSLLKQGGTILFAGIDGMSIWMQFVVVVLTGIGWVPALCACYSFLLYCLVCCSIIVETVQTYL